MQGPHKLLHWVAVHCAVLRPRSSLRVSRHCQHPCHSQATIWASMHSGGKLFWHSTAADSHNAGKGAGGRAGGQAHQLAQPLVLPLQRRHLGVTTASGCLRLGGLLPPGAQHPLAICEIVGMWECLALGCRCARGRQGSGARGLAGGCAEGGIPMRSERTLGRWARLGCKTEARRARGVSLWAALHGRVSCTLWKSLKVIRCFGSIEARPLCSFDGAPWRPSQASSAGTWLFVYPSLGDQSSLDRELNLDEGVLHTPHIPTLRLLFVRPVQTCSTLAPAPRMPAGCPKHIGCK